MPRRYRQIALAGTWVQADQKEGFTLHTTNSALILAAAAAVVNLALPPAAMAQQSANEKSSAEMAQDLKALREQVETLQRRLDAQIEAEQQAKAAADAAAA